jgi:23S rRNA (guanine745-N1)-methyltransferase
MLLGLCEQGNRAASSNSEPASKSLRMTNDATSLPLACTVRGCGEALAVPIRNGTTLRCPRGHSYDRARSGYWNLLQPQDSRRRRPGDDRSVVAARRRLYDSGVGQALLDAVAAAARGAENEAEFLVLDIGCGEGSALRRLRAETACRAIGVDLSVAAIECAARRDPHVTWLVANADRCIPVLAQSVDLVISLNARRPFNEIHRVLRRRGRALVAVPAPDDLAELRVAAKGSAVLLPGADGVRRECAGLFDVVTEKIVRDRRNLARAQLDDLLRIGYRGSRFSEQGRLADIADLSVTLSQVLLELEPREI